MTAIESLSETTLSDTPEPSEAPNTQPKEIVPEVKKPITQSVYTQDA